MPALAAVDFGAGVTSAFAAVMRFVPRFVAFVVILVIGWLIARALATLIARLAARFGFNRLIERGGLRGVLERGRLDAGGFVAKLVYYAVLLVTLQVAFGVWGPNPVSTVLTGVVAFIPKAIVAIVIIVVAAAIARALRDLVAAALGALSYGRLLANLTAAVVLFLGIIAALNQVQIATTVTQPVLITVLATIGGILVVGVGGGLVRPMQDRWQGWLGTLERETTSMRVQMAANRAVAEREAEARRAAAEQQAAEPPAASTEATRTMPLVGDEPGPPPPTP